MFGLGLGVAKEVIFIRFFLSCTDSNDRWENVLKSNILDLYQTLFFFFAVSITPGFGSFDYLVYIIPPF